jgi:hypothetical protein
MENAVDLDSLVLKGPGVPGRVWPLSPPIVPTLGGLVTWRPDTGAAKTGSPSNTAADPVATGSARDCGAAR